MKFDPEKIFNMLLLRPRKVSEEEKRYGTFNRRMIAASLDSLLVTVLIAPVVDYVFIRVYGAPSISVQEISAHASQAANSGEATRLFWEEMKSSGFLDRWLINFRWQIYALCIYATLCWHFWSATPGKILCRLKIVDSKTGERMGDLQSLLRVFGYFVSAVPLGLGFFWIGLNKKRRGWHDLLAGTEVVVLPLQREKAQATLKRKPLYKKILYGSLIIFFWVGVLLSRKYFDVHLGAIEIGVLTIIMLWLFSIATDLDMGFSERKMDPRVKPEDGKPTSTPESAHPSDSPAPSAGE